MKILPPIFLIFVLTLIGFGQIPARVITQQANVRELPTMDSAVVFKVKKDDRLKVLMKDNKDGWYPVQNPKTKKRGWIHGNAIMLLIIGPDSNTDELDKYFDEFLVNDKWILLYKDNIEETYLNPAKIQNLGNNNRSFWIKTVIIDIHAYWKQIIDKLGLEPEPATDTPTKRKSLNANNLSYALTLWNGNCQTLTLGAQNRYEYDNNNQIFGTPVKLNQPLEPVIPDSNGEFFLKRACNYVLK